MQTVVMKSITRVARTYLGMNQTQFAKAVNLTQPDLSELEQKTEPFGAIAKYRRISDYLGIPVDTLLRNDFTAIPEGFFEKFPPQPYTAVWNSSNHDLGRAGEEYIFRREQERLADLYPNLAKLILPFFKLDLPSPGFDILTFDALGVPYALEVKTTADPGGAFQLTTNEYAAPMPTPRPGSGMWWPTSAISARTSSPWKKFLSRNCAGTSKSSPCPTAASASRSLSPSQVLPIFAGGGAFPSRSWPSTWGCPPAT